MAVIRIQSLGGFHWRRGARLNFFRGFAADILVILSVDSGQFAGGLGLIYFDLKLHQDFSVRTHSYTLHLLISNRFCLDQDSTEGYVNLKSPQDSFDLFCLLQGWWGIGYHRHIAKAQIL
jgi:hypothetical protein